MPTIGVTGGIATGKSTVTALMRQLGAVVFSADEVAREVLAPGRPELAQVVERFGGTVLRPDGSLDRKALGDIVFGDPGARADLENLTHPPILDALRRRVAEAIRRHGPKKLVVVEVPLLYEAGMEDWFDEVVVVSASETSQVERIRRRDGLDHHEALARVRAQMPLAEKVRRADVVIVNDGDDDGLRRAVETCVRAAVGP